MILPTPPADGRLADPAVDRPELDDTAVGDGRTSRHREDDSQPTRLRDLLARGPVVQAGSHRWTRHQPAPGLQERPAAAAARRPDHRPELLEALSCPTRLPRRRSGAVEVGTGLNTRFDRLENGTVHWVDLDLPEVITLRRRFFTDTDRRNMIAASILDATWVEQVRALPAPCFVAAGASEQGRYLARESRRFGEVPRSLRSRLVAYPTALPSIVEALIPSMVRAHREAPSA